MAKDGAGADPKLIGLLAAADRPEPMVKGSRLLAAAWLAPPKANTGPAPDEGG